MQKSTHLISKSSKTVIVLLAAAMSATTLATGVASAAYTPVGTPSTKSAAKVSFAALNTLNISKSDAVSLLGSGAKFDTSQAGAADFSGSLTPADKAKFGSKLLAGYKEALGPTVTLSVSTLPYIVNLKSEVFPVLDGNGEAGSLDMLAASGANQVSVVNSNFPKGTYAVIFDLPLSTSYGVFHSKELKIVAGRGNKMAVYLLNFSPIQVGVSATGYAKLFTALENLVAKKVAGSSRTSI